MPPSLFFTDEDPETQRCSNLPEATQLPVADLGWDPGTLEESKAESTPWKVLMSLLSC